MKLLQILMMAKKGIDILINTCSGWTSNYRWSNVECDSNDLVLSELVGLDFDGTNDYVSVPNHSSLNPTSEITLSAWIRPDTEKTNATVIGRYASQGYGFGIYGGNLYFGVYASEWKTLEISDAYSYMPTGRWSHLVGVYNGSTQKLYVNGLEIGTRNQTGSISYQTTTLDIGRLEGVSGYYFDGKIRDARVYSMALSATDIEDLYNGETVDDTNLEGWWKLDEGTGTSATDSSDNTNTGTITGATWFNEYFETGERVSTPILIPAHTTSNIQWEKETDEDTDVKVYTGVTDSDDEEPADKITRDSTSDNYTTGTSLTVEHTCSGDNRLLVTYIFTLSSISDMVTGVTYGGDSMTRINTSALIHRGYMYYIVNPKTGTNNIVVSLNTSCDVRAQSVSYNGIKQTSPLNAQNSLTKSSSTSCAITVATTVKNCIAVVGFVPDLANSSSFTNGTIISRSFGESNPLMIVDTGNFTITANSGVSQNWAASIAAFEPELYTEVTNDSTIPDLEANKYLYCKQVLSTEDTSKTPKLNSLKIKIT